MKKSWTVNGTVYTGTTLLGHGKGGYSYLVKDPTGHEFTLKQIHHEPCSYYQFGNKILAEKNDYERLKSAGISLPQLLFLDETQEVILKEYIPGETIDRLVLKGEITAEIQRQIQALADLARAHGLNLDYYPTNFIFYKGTLYYIDYECNNYDEQWSFEKWGRLYWSQTPEFLQAFKRNQN